MKTRYGDFRKKWNEGEICLFLIIPWSYIHGKVRNDIGWPFGIRKDRKTTKKLLQDLVKEMATSHYDEVNKRSGIVAAKYLETLQRSNEQMVKIVGLLQKKQTQQAGLSKEDKDDIFEMIKEVEDAA